MKRSAIVIVGALTASSAWAASCPQPEGMSIGPIVPTADAARELYKTMAGIRHDVIRPTNDIVVHDERDHWTVFQYPKQVDVGTHPTHGGPVVSAFVGDGTLTLQIGKCDAHTVGYYSR